MSRQHGTAWLSLAALLAAVAFGLPDMRRTRADAGRAPISSAVRSDYPRNTEALARWLRRELKKGRTSFADVVAIFGPRCTNLDRPARDGILTIEYRLADLGVVGRREEKFLYFDFDARTRLLEGWHGWGFSLDVSGERRAGVSPQTQCPPGWR